MNCLENLIWKSPLDWRQVTEVIEGSIRNRSLPGHMGLFPFGCKMPGEEGNGTIGGFNLKYCEEWWLNLQTWEKIVSAAMVLAALIEAFALIWNLFTWCACCCKQFLLHPLTLASLCAAISLGVAVAFYGINNQSAFEGVLNWNDVKDKIETEVRKNISAREKVLNFVLKKMVTEAYQKHGSFVNY
ncbi:hypothetical protein ANCCAN_12065 [Ancylostoma caninum]|uniref:Uncharacterized protein n=1 Tax=Ancylostoma caninum TaxID=29170 RepID=A0A368GG08_ANCCA|nr:hypothetical protein ANCCAN_12065 [Ancylostoma caninum]